MTIRDDVRTYFEGEADRHPAPPGLRATALTEAHGRTVERGSAHRFDRPHFKWAGGFVAALLAVAVVASLLYSRAFLSVPGALPTVKTGTAAITKYVIPIGSPLNPYVQAHVVTVGPDGNLFVGAGGYIVKVSQSGDFTNYTIPTTDNMLPPRWVTGVTTGPDGNIWFTEFTEQAEGTGNAKTVIVGKVFKMTASGAFTEYPIPIGSNSSPQAITAGPDGNLWFTEPSKSMVAKITTSGRVTEYPIPIDSSVGARTPAITAGPDGNLWFTEPSRGIVAKMTTTGKFAEFRLPSAGYEPTDIAAGPDGNLWVTEAPQGAPDTRGRVARLTPSGSFTEYALPKANGYPIGITAGRDGNLWFVDGNKVARITTAGALTEYSTNEYLIRPITTSTRLNTFIVWFIAEDGPQSYRVGFLTPSHDPS
jgi:streptogramin lyase